MKKIAVFFGGMSQEHDVSVITGVFTLNCLDKTKYEGVPIYVSKDGLWFSGKSLFNISDFRFGEPKGLKRVALFAGDNNLYEMGARLKRKFVLSGAINCMHGRNGEDGTLAAVCKLSKVPLASPDLFSSAMAMDKELTKTCLNAIGVKTAEGFTVARADYYADTRGFIKKTEKLGYPVIIKPCSSGSSIGITVAHNEKEAEKGLNKAFTYDVKAVVERFIKGASDVNCACYKAGGSIFVSECERPAGGEFLSFNDKYLGGAKSPVKRQFPAKISKTISDEIKATTAYVYKKFDFSGIVRIDYLVCGDEIVLNEINSVPGSLAYYLFCDKIADFTNLLTALIEESFTKWREYFNCRFTFSSSVLALDGVIMKK